jgi:hypothetical protein
MNQSSDNIRKDIQSLKTTYKHIPSSCRAAIRTLILLEQNGSTLIEMKNDALALKDIVANLDDFKHFQSTIFRIMSFFENL